MKNFGKTTRAPLLDTEAWSHSRCAISRYPFSIGVINIHCINVHYIYLVETFYTMYYASIFIECCSSLKCDKTFRSSCRFACQHRFSISVRMCRLHDHLTDSVRVRLHQTSESGSFTRCDLMWMRLRFLMRFCKTVHMMRLRFISFVWIAHRNWTEWVSLC